MSIMRSAGRGLLASLIVLTVCSALVATPRAVSSATAGPTLEGTAWALQKLAVDASLADVPSDVAATLYLQDGRASGDAGCNTFAGDYSIDGDALAFEPIMSTMMICEGQRASTEAAYLAAFPLVTSYALDGEALSLLDASGTPVLTYAAVATQPVAGSWIVTSYNTDRNDMAPPLTGSILTAVFGPDGTIEGDSSCNHFSGPYTTDGDGIAIGPLVSTLITCGSDDLQDQETQYLALLTASDKWSLDGDVLELIDTQGVGRQTTVVFSDGSAAAYIGAWVVTAHDDGDDGVVTPVGGSTLTAAFLPDGNIKGNAGCNSFSGPYTAVGTSMTIGPLATTRMACTSPALDTQEQQLLTALQSVATWEVDDGLTLRDWDGATQVVLTMARGE